MRKCIECLKNLEKRHQIKFCSNKCQMAYQYNIFLQNWKSGTKDGNRGLNAKTTSRHLRRYLGEKYGEKCAICGWNKKHPSTQSVPLEIEHIDGNAENNKESNLTLLCPNCHALTPHFRNLNRGNGRVWRKNKYLKNTV